MKIKELIALLAQQENLELEVYSRGCGGDAYPVQIGHIANVYHRMENVEHPNTFMIEEAAEGTPNSGDKTIGFLLLNADDLWD
jgi:hypothetical protein